MNTDVSSPPRWSTSSIPDATDTSPMELGVLGDHVSDCNGSRGRWFTLRCAVDAVHDFIAPRFVTTLVIVGLALALAALAL